MAPSPLDLQSLAAYNPLQILCPGCRASYHGALTWIIVKGLYECRVCQYPFGSAEDSEEAVKDGLRRKGLIIGEQLAERWGGYHSVLEHLRRLGQLARQIENERIEGLPTLIRLLNAARLYIHFSSYGQIRAPMLSLIQRFRQPGVVVAGIVGQPSDHLVVQQQRLLKEFPSLNIRVAGAARGLVAMPHGKLLIIDGLIALSGSLNFTKVAWQRAAKKLETIHVFSEPTQVSRLNNQFFAPAWWAAEAENIAAARRIRRPRPRP